VGISSRSGADTTQGGTDSSLKGGLGGQQGTTGYGQGGQDPSMQGALGSQQGSTGYGQDPSMKGGLSGQQGATGYGQDPLMKGGLGGQQGATGYGQEGQGGWSRDVGHGKGPMTGGGSADEELSGGPGGTSGRNSAARRVQQQGQCIIEDIKRGMDQAVESIRYSGFTNIGPLRIFAFDPNATETKIELRETDRDYNILLYMPGLIKKHVKLWVDDNRVVEIEAAEYSEERLEFQREEDTSRPRTGHYHHRKFTIPSDAKRDSLRVFMEHGVLAITLLKEHVCDTTCGTHGTSKKQVDLGE